MGLEFRPVLANHPPFGEAEYLEPAAVCEDGTRPADEAMQPSPARDELVARAKE